MERAGWPGRHAVLDEIRRLDPALDHARIVYLSTCFDFPFDTPRALELALFRTYCVPGISALLDRTGEFGRRAQKRYDDTDLILSEIMECGYASERGAAALARMNHIHGRFEIPNDQYLYVLSTFVFEPVRWNARFGWRPMCVQERLAFFHFWREVGLRMGIRDIPEDHAEYERFNRDYEVAHFRFAESNRRVGTATREMFVAWFPKPLAPLVRRAIHALLEERMIAAFGFPPAPRWLRRLLPALLRLRARAVRWLPPRRNPRLRTRQRHPSYPEGYRIDTLGPPGS